MQKTLIIKLSIIAGLCLIFAIGLNIFRSVIYERQHYAESVVNDIEQQHVNPQEVITPFIAIAQTTTPKCTADKNGKMDKCSSPYTTIKAVLAKQTQAQQKLDVSTDTYHRGIYHAISYNGDLTFEQNYAFEVASPIQGTPVSVKPINNNNTTNTGATNPTASDMTTTQNALLNQAMIQATSQPNLVRPEYTVTHWDSARLILPVSDLRGVATLPTVTIGGKELKATYPETPLISSLSYVEVILPDDLLIVDRSHTKRQSQSQTVTKTFDIAIHLPLSGISKLNTVPLGQNFEMGMTSNWHAPKFIGKALPNTKNFTDTGFSANWQNQYLTVANNQTLHQCLSIANRQCGIRSYASSASSDDAALGRHSDYNPDQTTTSAGNSIRLNSFGVNFVEPNDVYLQTERTMKYALLLILVSFGTFFLFEVIKSSRIHPIQYLLVGCALLVFYVLLLPLAEQIIFWKAYLIAATACVGLIGWYAYYMLGTIKRAAIFTAILAGLYASFYGILTTEDLNLLLGAVFCFVLLAAVMVMTRKIDWYKVT